MFAVIAVAALAAGLLCLGRLWVVDLKTFLLPNEYVLGFFMCAALFHLATAFYVLSPQNMALGAFMGGTSLWLVRFVSGLAYKKDALGWGDIKLMAAAGALLGPYYIWLALALGAGAGIIHGLILHVKNKNTGTASPLLDLSLPAGPGFITGIIITSVIAFQNLGDAL